MTTYNAERSTFQLAGITIETFMLPNGEFRYSQTSAAGALKKDRSDAGKYFRSNTAKSLLGETSTRGSIVSVGRTRIAALTDVEVAAYWQWKAENGNKEAQALMAALAVEALHRRACVAFGVTVSEEQHEQRTKEVREWLVKQISDLNIQRETEMVLHGYTQKAKDFNTKARELAEANNQTKLEFDAQYDLVDAFKASPEYQKLQEVRRQQELQAVNAWIAKL